MARLRRDHRSKKIEDVLVADTKFVELGAKDAPVDNVSWDVQKAEVHADPIMDSGTGAKVIIRRFKFQLPPGLVETPGHQELLDWHKKNTVIPVLYRDGLELIKDPGIVAGKKGAFTIVAICAPRVRLGMREIIQENASNVTDIINATTKHNSE